MPTTVADTLRPHAERTLAAAEETRLAAQRVKRFETGTIRFGMFGTARLYAGAGLVADVLERHPGVRVELVGQNSTEVQEDLRRGRLEAAIIAMPQVESEGMQVIPVAKDEIVYISADPETLASPMTAKKLAAGLAGDARDDVALDRLDPDPAAPDAARDRSATRRPGSRSRTSRSPSSWSGLGLADSVIPRGAAVQLLPRLAPNAGWVSMRPKLYDHVRDRAPRRAPRSRRRRS